MLSLIPGALVGYGFNDRVLTLYNTFADDLLSAADPLWRDGRAGGGALPARVTRVERSACFAVLPDGDEHMLRADPLPAVGDWILTVSAAVAGVLPRWSALQRVAADGESLQTLAANVDLVAVVTPADHCSPARVEREIALAWDSGAVPLVVVTKSDLDPGGAADSLVARLGGVDVLAVSVVDDRGVEQLAARLSPDRTAVLLGPSGAGKSTLANRLLGRAALATATVRDGDGRGRHTTSSRQMIALPGGGVLIDTPGLRSLGLPPDLDVGAGFSDIMAVAADCRFRDCAHDGEPGCAVIAAVAAGALDPERLASFRKLAREVAWEQRRHDPLKAREARQLWRARTREARRHRRGE